MVSGVFTPQCMCERQTLPPLKKDQTPSRALKVDMDLLDQQTSAE